MSYPYESLDYDFPDLTNRFLTKQDVLNIDGVAVNTNVSSTFTIGGSEDNNDATSLVSAKAVEDWFELLQQSLVQVQPGQQGPSFRVGTINTSSPSSLNVPTCSAVNSFVSSRLSPYVTLHYLQTNYYSESDVDSLLPTYSSQYLMDRINERIPLTQVVTSINETATAVGTGISDKLCTETAIVDFLGNPTLENAAGQRVTRAQPKLFCRKLDSNGFVLKNYEDSNFQFIKASVHCLSGVPLDPTNDVRLATCAAIDSHITTRLSPLIEVGEVHISFISLKYQNDLVIGQHITVRSDVGDYKPIVVSNVIFDSGLNVKETILSKLEKPTSDFVWPSGVTATKLGYLSNVTSDIQAQIDAV
jgi:hypothetical protein